MAELGKEKLWVLILDDSEIVLQMTAQALKEAGFEVVTANSLMEFDKLLTKGRPDIILTDIQMPEISGDNVCKVLKEKHDTANTPIVLFSTLDESELIKLAERSGADGYVCKNDGIDKVVARIKALTEEILF
jgi:DNA-binding response OmpR family regulator